MLINIAIGLGVLYILFLLLHKNNGSGNTVYIPILGPGGTQRYPSNGPGHVRHPKLGPGGTQHMLGPGGLPPKHPQMKPLGPGGKQHLLGPGGKQRLLGM